MNHETKGEKTKAKVTISRSSNDKVYIRVTDVASGIEFANIALSIEAYGYAITGLSEQEGDLEVRGLEWVGKKRITEQRSIECPLKTYKTEELRRWLKENAQEDGWLLDTYLGSKSSVRRVGDVTVLNYSVTKYVDEAA